MQTTSPDDDVIDAMSTFVRAWRRVGRLLPDRTTAALHQLVHLLGDGPLRLGEIAGRRGIDQSVASRQVDDLVARGLVRRRPDPSDGRACLVELTVGGRELLARTEALRHDIVQGALARSPAADLPAVTRFVTALADELTLRSSDPTPIPQKEHRP